MDCLFLYFPLLSFFLLSENVPLSLVYFPFETIFHLTSINGSYVLIHPAVFLTFSKSESVRMNILRILTGSGENEERSILFFCLFLLSFVAYLSLLCFFFFFLFFTRSFVQEGFLFEHADMRPRDALLPRIASDPFP